MTVLSVRADEDYPPRRAALIGLAGLMVACFFSFLDRHILSLLVQPIKHDLLVTDAQIGVLQGIAFALSYSVFALLFGWMADRYHRIRIICFGMIVWSIATFGSGLSNSFTELLIARVLVGVGEAALMPAAYSLLSDYFPPSQRGRVFAVFMSAMFLGAGGALVAGGAVLRLLSGVDAVSLPLVGTLAVWKAAFIVVGTPGLVAALLLLLLREPTRRGYPPPTSKDAAGLTVYVRQHPGAFFTVLSAYSLLALVGYAVSTWAPTLLIRNYGLDPAAAGMTTGLTSLAAGVVGAAVGGILGDRWVATSRPGGRLPLTYFLWVGGLPFLVLFGFAGDVRWAVVGFLFYAALNVVSFVSSSAVMQDMVPGHLRGRTTALWYLITGIIGNGFGPVVIGVFNDYVFRSDAALPYSILAVTAPSLLLGLIITSKGMTAYDRACSRKGAPIVRGQSLAGDEATT